MRECSPPPTCHVSRVTCHVSCVTCHVSHVIFFCLFFGQSGEAYRWRVCYQRGLLRLVTKNTCACSRENSQIVSMRTFVSHLLFMYQATLLTNLLATIINRPSVAGTILQTALSYTGSVN